MVFISGIGFSQKYLQLVPEIAPDSGACNGKVRAIMHGGVSPYNMISMTDHVWEISTGTFVETICDELFCSATFVDDECSELNSNLRVYSDTSKQIYLDTIYITMPSSQSNCNGQITLVFRHIQPNHSMYFGSSTSGFATSSFSFTGLCSDLYYYSITSPGSIPEYEVQMDLRVNPIPCFDFEANIGYTPVQDTANCTGEIHFNPTGGSGSGPFAYDFYHPVGGIYEILGVNEAYTNFRDSLCVGPYTIDVFNNFNSMRKRYSIYLDVNAIAPSNWNFPDSLLPNTDTILLSALTNCAINYNIGIDTAYISSFNGIGNNQYEIEITFIQDTNTIIIHSTAIVDTSLNFFLDITTFCPDSSRSNSGYYSLRSMLYHGVKLQSIQNINENNFFSSFKIYPNPSEEIFQIDFEAKESSLLNFEVTDITGKIIRSINYSSTIGKNHLNLNLDQYASGLYILNVRSEKGLLHSKKLVKN